VLKTKKKEKPGKMWFKTPGACIARRRKKAECDDETRNEDESKQ
jgi:hypothetical protein